MIRHRYAYTYTYFIYLYYVFITSFLLSKIPTFLLKTIIRRNAAMRNYFRILNFILVAYRILTFHLNTSQ